MARDPKSPTLDSDLPKHSDLQTWTRFDDFWDRSRDLQSAIVFATPPAMTEETRDDEEDPEVQIALSSSAFARVQGFLFDWLENQRRGQRSELKWQVRAGLTIYFKVKASGAGHRILAAHPEANDWVVTVVLDANQPEVLSTSLESQDWGATDPLSRAHLKIRPAELDLLLVEDVAELGEELAERLRRAPGVARVTWVADTWAARRHVERNRPSLVLCDELLPAESPIDWVTELAAETPVIWMTETPGNGPLYGALGRIRKPSPVKGDKDSGLEEFFRHALSVVFDPRVKT
jgi:hypothetical protein